MNEAEMKQIADDVIKEWVACAKTYTPLTDKDKEALTPHFKHLCRQLKLPFTSVKCVKSPAEACKLYKEITKSTDTDLVIYNKMTLTMVDCYWYTATDYLIRTKQVRNYKILQSMLFLAKSTSMFLLDKDIIIAVEKPVEVHLDANNLYHNTKDKAVKWADKSGFYFYHGNIMPQEYASPIWKAEWLLKEENVTRKQWIIREVGYEKILQELKAKKLDAWREYELYRIDDKADIEPIYLLSMTCPSTGQLHVHRTAPTVKTCEEAVVLLNKGIHPDEFEWQR